MADDKRKQDKEEYAYKKMLEYGWKPHQASAIVGNLKRESNFNTSIVGTADDKGSQGVAQWHSGRLDNLKKKYGSNWTSFDNQLEFVNWELNNTHKSAGDDLRKTKGVWDAGRVVTDKYEAPKVKWDRDEKRQNYVTDNYRKYSGVQLTEEDKNNFLKGTAQRAIDNYNSSQNIDFSNSAEGITFEEEKPEKETETTQALKGLQERQKEEDFLTELFSGQEQKIAELYKPIEEEQGSQPQSYDYNDISNFVESPILAQQGIKIDNMGYWNPQNWGKHVQINSNNITMEGVNQPLIGYAPETGEKKLMMPNTNHIFNGAKRVIESPLTEKEKQFLKEITKIK